MGRRAGEVLVCGDDCGLDYEEQRGEHLTGK
jgi:hypothetical protein